MAGFGGAPRVERFLAELRAGATLIVNAVQETGEPLRGLCAGLAGDFACHCQANLYASFGATRGFDVHWDEHDVVVVHLAGRKLWRLHGLARAAPVVRADPADHVAPAKVKEERILEAGDVLYLPRGYWHAAVGLAEASLHLTIGLTRRTGSEFLHWLADHLLGEEPMRRDLPFEAGDAAVASRLTGVFERLATLDPLALAGGYRRAVEGSLAFRPRLSLPSLGGEETTFARDDRLRLTDGAARLEPADRSGAVVLSWRGVRFTIDARLAEPLGALVAGEVLTVAAIARWADDAAVQDLARDLLARGVLARA